MAEGKVRIAIKEPNKELRIVEVEKGYRSKTIKSFIPSLENPYDSCDYVKCSKDGLMTVAVDEMGLIRELEPNFYMETNHFPAECLVGVAVFSRVEYVNVFVEEIYDYTLTDLTDEDIEHIKKTLDKEYQAYVESVYKGNGGKLQPLFKRIF